MRAWWLRVCSMLLDCPAPTSFSHLQEACRSKLTDWLHAVEVHQAAPKEDAALRDSHWLLAERTSSDESVTWLVVYLSQRCVGLCVWVYECVSV